MKLSSGWRIFAGQIGITFASLVSGVLLSMMRASIVSRSLGPRGKGTLELALLVPSFLGIFLGGGIDIANVYFLGTRRSSAPVLATNSVVYCSLATLLGWSILFFLFAVGWLDRIVPGLPLHLIGIAALGLPIAMLNSAFNCMLQGQLRIIRSNMVALLQGFTTLILTIFLVWLLRLGVPGVLLAFLFSGLITTFILSSDLYGKEGGFSRTWDPKVLYATLSFGLKGYVGNMLQFFNYRLDMFIVNFYLEPYQVGIYSVSVTMAELLWYLPNAVGFVIFPKAASTSAEEMNKLTPRVFLATLVLTAFGASVLVAVGDIFIRIIFSSAFSEAYRPLLYLLPGVVSLSGAKVLTNEITGRGYPQYNSFNTGVVLICTVGLDLALIPRYGILGASITSSIVYTLSMVLAVISYAIVSKRAASPEAQAVEASEGE